MVLIPQADLYQLAFACLNGAGCEPLEADRVAQHLVDANLAGHDSHGMGMLPLYLASVRRGGLIPNCPPKLVTDFGAVLVYDGERGFGHSAARTVLDAAMRRASELGVALVSLRNAGHLGRIGDHGEYVAQAGMAALMLVNAVGRPATVAPFGGLQARLASNPFCLAYPAIDGQVPIVLDAATAAVAVGKARVAKANGLQLPAGLLLDDAGQPTTDPRFALGDPHGAILPFGLHKGSGLGLFCDLFAGALMGGETIQPGNGNQQRMAAANNLFALVVNPQSLGDTTAADAEARALLNYFRSARPVDPGQPVLVPGENEARTRAQRLEHGIELDLETWGQLVALAKSLGLTCPEPATSVA